MQFTVVYRAVCSLFVELVCSPICLLYLLIAVLVYKRRFQSAMQSCAVQELCCSVLSLCNLCNFSSAELCYLLCNFMQLKKLHKKLCSLQWFIGQFALCFLVLSRVFSSCLLYIYIAILDI